MINSLLGIQTAHGPISQGLALPLQAIHHRQPPMNYQVLLLDTQL